MSTEELLLMPISLTPGFSTMRIGFRTPSLRILEYGVIASRESRTEQIKSTIVAIMLVRILESDVAIYIVRRRPPQMCVLNKADYVASDDVSQYILLNLA